MNSAIRISLLLCLAMRCIGSTRAAEVHVPGDYKTIQAAIDEAKNGDVVIVAPGTYREHLTITGKRLTLASQFLRSQDSKHVEQTILDGMKAGKKTGPLIYVKNGVESELRIVGFTIQNGDHAVVVNGRIEVSHNRFTDNVDSLSFENGKGIVRHNIFENDDDDGIDMDGSSEATIENNIIRNNKDDGIEVRLHKYAGPTLKIVIRHNSIMGNREDGLQLIDYPGKSDREFRIERNLFSKNAMAAIGCMSDGNTKENFQGADLVELVLVINNTLIDNQYAITGGDNVILLNNIIFGTAKVALKRVHGDSYAGPNLLWNNHSDFEECDLNPAMFVSTDPLLNETHKPIAGSPCIDAGVASLQYNGEELKLPSDSFHGVAPDFGFFELEK